MMEKDNEKRQLVISPTTDSQDFYEQLVNEYPTCGRFWKAYIENELKARNFEKVEKLFQRCLLKVLNVELWRCYLNYVRDVKSKMPNHKEKTAQAYDFALEKIGLDVQSYSIWVDYINFLKSVEAIGSFAENQKITAIRKVYQKGVMNPMLNVDQLWKDYCIFENQINPLIAKRMIDDRSRDYMSVRKIAKEYENVTRPLDRTSPGLPIPTGTADELRQKQMWRKYIEWERTSPTLRGANNNATTTTSSGGGGGGGGGSGNVDDSLIMTTSPAILHHVAKRVMYAYEQWLLAMPKHPDIWVEYAAYLQEQSARMADKSGTSTSASASSDVGAWARVYAQEAVQVFERALAVCSSCPLVYFAYADFEEGRLNHTKVKEIYDKLLEKKEIDPSLCYIQYMRFLRRVEGIRSARTVFKRARDDPRSSYHVYMAAAFMEYYCTKDISIAYKILQSGLKQFGHIPEFVLGFIELAKHINDNDTIKHLFETVLNNDQNDISVQMNKEKTEQIWLEWLDFERNANTSLEAIEDVAQKRQAFYLSQPNASSMFDERQSLLLIDRYSYHSLRPCTQLELASIGYKPDCALLALDLQPLLTTHHQQQAHHATITSSPTSNDDESGEKRRSGSSKSSSKSAWPEPDPSRMIAFKPSRRAEFGFMQPIPGGGMFLFPSIFADLIKRLPPPHCFQGPFVNIDEFIVNFKNLTIPEDFQKFQVEDSIKTMQDGADDDEIESDAPKQQRNQRKPSSSSTAATTSSR